MELNKPNLDEFFESLNEIISETFEFEEINEYLEQGHDSDESETDFMTKKEKAAR